MENNDDPVSLKSRTGFIIFLSACPIIWLSKLQWATDLSSTEAKVVALSMAIKALVSVRRLIADETNTLDSKLEPTIKVFSKVFEDNNDAISLSMKESVFWNKTHPLQSLVLQREHW